MVTARVPATTANLGPGFDSLALALGLYNEVSLVAMAGTDSRLEVTVQGEGEGQLPRDDENLVVQAARLLSEQTGRLLPGLTIRQVNCIPVSSGLGSSAAAVVGGLLAADLLLGAGLPKARLLRLATQLEGHADNVAAALYGGLVVVNESDGEQFVEQVPLPPVEVVVILPAFELSTRQARAALPATVPLRDAAFNAGRAALLVWSLSQGKRAQLPLAMADRLHQPYRIPLIPGMAAAFEVAQAAGAAVALSGAGPSLLAIAPDQPEPLLETLVATFREAGISSRSWILQSVKAGAVATREKGTIS